jgi:hypothetical protein
MATTARPARRGRAPRCERAITGTPLGDGADATMLAVAFPHDQVQISYNRTVKDLGGLAPRSSWRRSANGSRSRPARRPSRRRARSGAAPARRRRHAQAGGTRFARTLPDPSDAIGSLDVSVLGRPAGADPEDRRRQDRQADRFCRRRARHEG